MQSVTNRYTRSRAPSPSKCEPAAQTCSTCGMLECLCRPRFFAGQVLTADDLNRLESYVIGKNRLRNRQLHGWGVVNGLEVTCDECGKGVIVGCGYALSPCGDDIVVCDPVVVDVCALIKACREVLCRQPCDPPRPNTPGDCGDQESEWILCVRYSESPTRGIKPLLREPANGCGCDSKSSSGCGCGGNGNGSGRCNCQNGSAKTKPRTAPVQCEPTIICEGFAFDVYPKPPDADPGSTDGRVQLNPDSELYKRFACASDLLVKRIPKMPGTLNLNTVTGNLPAWQQWMCTFKDYLKAYLTNKPSYNCELLSRLNSIVCPPANNTNATLVFQSIVLLMLVWVDALLAGFCSALLPPCPEAVQNDCVPLASIRVSGQTCRVLSICNWTVHRKFAVNFPALQYWLSVLPFGSELRRILDNICCLQLDAIPNPQQDTSNNITGAVGGPPPPAGASVGTAPGAADVGGAAYERATSRLNPTGGSPERLQTSLRLTTDALARGRTPIDPQVFAESAFLTEQSKGTEHLSASDLDNLPQFLMLNQVARPMFFNSVPKGAIGAMLAGLQLGGFEMPVKAQHEPDVERLRKEVEGLRSELKRQAQVIERLQKPSKGKG